MFAELSPPYRTIVADPPWSYPDTHRWPSSTVGQSHRSSERPPGLVYRTAFDYSTMEIDEIAALDVATLAAVNCRLFLWTTNAFLFDAPRIFTAWGFTYRQTLVWHKSHQPPPFGGSVAPNAAEFLLVATRGHPPVVERAASSVIAAPRSRMHSAKPGAFCDLVERVSPGPYLELFARQPRLGWDSWGYGYESAARV